MQTTSDTHHHKGPRAMSLSDGMAKPDDINGGRVTGSAQLLADACSSILVPPQTRTDAPRSSWPGMQLPDWLLDLKQIMCHPQVSVMISDQDQDFLGYIIDLKVSEGD